MKRLDSEKKNEIIENEGSLVQKRLNIHCRPSKFLT